MKRRWLSFLSSLLISGGLLFFLFSRIEIGRLKEVLVSLYWPWLVIYLVVALAASLLRTWRYQLLLKPRPAKFGDFLLVTLIRNLFVDLLPARVGSLSYVYLTNRSLNYPFQAAASSFLLAFLFDFLTLTPFLLVAIAWVGGRASALNSFYLVVISILFFALILIIFTQLEKILRCLAAGGSRLKQKKRLTRWKWLQRFLNLATAKSQETAEELVRVKKSQSSWLIFFLSLLIRSCKYISLYFLLSALLHHELFNSTMLDFWTTILAITGAELTSVLPIKGLAGFGTWEAAWALSLSLMGYEAQLAIISGLGLHLLTNLYEYSLGIGAIIILTLRSPSSFSKKDIR